LEGESLEFNSFIFIFSWIHPPSKTLVTQLQSPEFAAALNHYTEFVAFNTRKSPANICPTLTYIMAHGDTSVHSFTTVRVEWENGGMTNTLASSP